VIPTPTIAPDPGGMSGVGFPVGEIFLKEKLLHKEDNDMLEIIMQAILSEIVN